MDSSDGFGEGRRLMVLWRGGGRSVTEIEWAVLAVPSVPRQRTPIAEEMRKSESHTGLAAQLGG